MSGVPVDGLTMSAAIFRIDLRDDIHSVTAPGTTFIFFQNVGETRRQGLELAARFERGALDLRGTYAYIRSTFENDVELATPRSGGGETVRAGSELPSSPHQRFDVEARVRVLSWLTLLGGVRYTGSQYFVGDEANVAPKVAPYAILRAGAEARWRSFTAYARVFNLLDTPHETFGTFAPNGRAGVTPPPIEPFLNPGPPRSFLAGLRWDL